MSTLSSSPSATSSTSSPESLSDAQHDTEDSDVWTRHQENLFENALSIHDLDIPERWENIAALVPGKDASAVKRHYELLVEDVKNIDLGKIVLPPYPSLSENRVDGSGESSYVKNGAVGDGSSNGSSGNSGSGKVGNNKASDQERKKGIPWTEEEHR